MKIKIHLAILICAISFTGFAQIGIGTTSPDASSVLDMTSTTQGVLIPRMTTTQREAVASPAMGLQVYDTDTKSVWSYNGATWINGTGGPGKFIDGATTDIAYYEGKVGIGRDNFSDVHKLYVDGIKSTDGTNTAAIVNATYTGTGTNSETTAVGAVTTNASTGTINFAAANRGIINNIAGGGVFSAFGSWQSINNTGAMTNASGSLLQINSLGTGTIASAYNQNAQIYNDDFATIDDARASYLLLSNFGTMTEAHGLYLDYSGSGTTVDSYALYINSTFNQGTNDNFAIYSASDADSYLEGNVGVGTTDPQQKVHISGAMRLEPQATPPTGALGDLYVSSVDNSLYFHDGTAWRQVSLVP